MWGRNIYEGDLWRENRVDKTPRLLLLATRSVDASLSDFMYIHKSEKIPAEGFYMSLWYS